MSDVVKIPQGKLKILNLADIQVGERYRENLGDLDALAESIKEKGILQPVTVDTNYNLLAGGRRIAAAGIAGLTKIPALIRETSGEIDAREVELLENIMRKDFSWDEEARLIRDIDALYKSQNMDWSGRKTATLLDKGVATVARAIQLANAIDVIPELGEMKTADDALKTIKVMEEEAIVTELRRRQNEGVENAGKETTNEHGEKLSGTFGISKDLASMLKIADSNYRIGDTFKYMAELRSGGLIHFIECDPPYGIELNKVKGSKDTAGNNVDSYQEVAPENYQEFLDKLTKELFRVANDHCWLVFWYGPTWHTQVHKSLCDAGWLVDEIPAIWVKGGGQTLQPEIYLGRAYEPFFICRKGKPVLMKRGRSNVFIQPGVSGVKKYHPTERPVMLIEELIECFAASNGYILVPFAGSGATLRAAYNQGHKVVGYDINSKYKNKFMLKVEEDARALLLNDDAKAGDEPPAS